MLERVNIPGRQAHWLVRCSCGREDVVPSQVDKPKENPEPEEG